jgi:phage-related protein
LRIRDTGGTWRIVYRIDRDAIVIAEVFSKKTQAIPAATMEVCRKRFREYDNA